MLALREIRRRRTQFALISMVVALISYLVFMVNGLGTGLNNQAGSALQSLNADGLAYSPNAGLSIIRSELSTETVSQIQTDLSPVTSAPLGYFGINTRSMSGRITSAAMLGIHPGTIAEPEIVDGRSLSSIYDHRSLLADRGFLRAAEVNIGDEILLVARGKEELFRIVGAVDEGSFFFQPTVYVVLDSLRELKYGSITSDTPLASVLLLQGENLSQHRSSYYELVNLDVAFANIEGVAGQQATVSALRFFGYLIGALVIGIFFYVLTMQKLSQTGLLKAIGAGNTYVFRQLLLQVMVVIGVGLILAAPLAALTDWLLSQSPNSVPISLSVSDYTFTAVLFIAVGIIGAAFSIRQIAKIDPIIALGRQD